MLPRRFVAVLSWAATTAGLALGVGASCGLAQLYFRVRPSRDRLVWLDGMCPEFLASFPGFEP